LPRRALRLGMAECPGPTILGEADQEALSDGFPIERVLFGRELV